MWFRFLLVSSLNVAATVFAVLVMVLYIVPPKTPLLLLNVANWFVAFILGYVFTVWAFAKQLPTRRSVIMLVALHAIVAITGYAVYGIFFSDRGPGVVVTREVLVQLAAELGSIVIASYRIRRHRLQAAVGEGMEI